MKNSNSILESKTLFYLSKEQSSKRTCLNIQVNQIKNFNPVRYAIRTRKLNLLKLLIKKYSIKELEESYSLHYAAYYNNIPAIDLLYKKGLSIKRRSSKGPPLVWALYKGNYNATKRLLELGADPNVSFSEGTFPLRFASANGNRKIVSVLLSFGADVNMLREATALHSACAYGHKTIARLLLKWGANPKIRNKYGKTAASYLRLNQGHQSLKKFIA